MWRCTHGCLAYTALVPSATEGIGTNLQVTHAIAGATWHQRFAVCGFQCAGCPGYSLDSTKSTSGKDLEQVEAAEVARKTDDARPDRPSRELQLSKREN